MSWKTASNDTQTKNWSNNKKVFIVTENIHGKNLPPQRFNHLKSTVDTEYESDHTSVKTVT